MKLILMMTAGALLLCATDPQTAKKTTAPAPAKQIKPVEIPKDAVETEPGTFHYTDAAGKKWIYRKTPWGVARVEDKPTDTTAAASQQPAADTTASIKVTEEGDTIHFERPGPFGAYKWQKKISELDETERAALERSRTNTKAKQD
jgi:hypothetical protein